MNPDEEIPPVVVKVGRPIEFPWVAVLLATFLASVCLGQLGTFLGIW